MSFFPGFPGGISGKEPACQCRRHKRHRLNPWVGEDPLEEGHGNPLQYSCLGNPMDRGTWRAMYGLWGHKESDMTEVTSYAHALKTQESRDLTSEGRRRWMSQLLEKEKFCPFSAFCFIQTLSGLDGTHPHWRGWASLLSLLIQLFTSYRHTQKSCFTSYLGIPEPSKVDT